MVSAHRSIGTGAVGHGGEPSPTRKRPDLCANHGHPGVTYNPWMNKTWCLCGEVVRAGNHFTHSACCGGPLEERVGEIAATCQGCGVDLTDDNTACQPCDRCHDCLPGSCWECRELRRENEADRMLRLSREAQTWG